MAISPLLIDKFAETFSGNTKAYGKYTVKGVKDNKVTGSAFTEIGFVKKNLYQQHLEGEEGLGIIPINSENKCIFGAIDIDDYEINKESLLEKIKANNLPLIMFRSKSGGIHLFLFLKTWTDAASVQDALSFFSITLGYKRVEIFPKQKKLEKSKVGNWINLPYFDCEKTDRYAFDYAFDQLNLFDALKLIDATKVDILELQSFIENFPNKDAPPCLQFLINSLVIPPHTRNNFLLNAGIYLKQLNADTWQNELVKLNSSMEDPLSISELTSSVINSLNKKEYFYTCPQEPIASYCDKELCRQRKFGINSDSIPSEIIGDLIKYSVLPPIWQLNVNGVYINFRTEELMNHIIYQKKCFEKLHTWPKSLKKESWRKIIEERLNNVDVREAPEEASQDGFFKALLVQFCTERAEALTRDQVLNKRVFTGDGFHYFRGTDFLDFLRFNNFTYYNRQEVFLRFRELGGIPVRFRVSPKVIIRAWRIKVQENPRLKIENAMNVLDFDKFDEKPF
jgi:hypothetical protein